MQKAQEELCRCCGRLPAVTQAIMNLRATRMSRPFAITDEMRQKLPPDVLESLEEMPSRMAAPSPGHELRVGFCNMCDRAGCDGVSPCKVPAEHWQHMERNTSMRRVLEQADDLERRWRQGELGQKGEATIAGWVPVTEDYWRSEIPTASGTAIAEAVRDSERGTWLARVKLAEEPEPLTVGNVTVHESAGTTVLMDLESLEAAQAACAEMVTDISAGDVPRTMDIMVGYTVVADDESGIRAT